MISKKPLKGVCFKQWQPDLFEDKVYKNLIVYIPTSYDKQCSMEITSD